MKKILILAEHRQGQLKKSTAELLGACKGLEVHALLFGSGAQSAADELVKKGVKTVHWVKDAAFDNYHPEAYTKAAGQALDAAQPDLVLGNSSSLGKDLMPRWAAQSDCSLVADCIQFQITPELKMKRPFFSGKALAEIERLEQGRLFVTVRPNSLPPGDVGGAGGSVQELKAGFDFGASRIQFVERTKAVSDRPDLTEASIIISGGRSLKSKENFSILFEAADVLGAAVGASRAAVDEGLASHDMQVGQTGKTVNPNLYIACGISGAIQHLAGMRTSKVIVAINKDPNAPIFQKADYGVVGDLFTIVPLLTKELKKQLQK